jgi:hypothetical protein
MCGRNPPAICQLLECVVVAVQDENIRKWLLNAKINFIFYFILEILIQYTLVKLNLLIDIPFH